MKIIWKNIEKEINTYAKTVLKPISGHIVKIEINRVKKGNYVTGLWISISVDAKTIMFVISKSITKKEFEYNPIIIEYCIEDMYKSLKNRAITYKIGDGNV